jgi:trehalose 6-phosphate synthase/phosphatase
MARWITVANRLPFSISSGSSPGKARKITPSSGGLVSALSGVKSKGERIWIGCAPDNLTPDEWPMIARTLSAGSSTWSYEPLFMQKKLYDSYYNGCCNDVLWPLLHYQTELVAFDHDCWESYQEANRRFAARIAEIASPEDMIWIHDFHLFLVPKLLKQMRPELKTGFFLHVPFPSSEAFRQLPVREEILDSLLHADLIGFHDYSYLRHFTSSTLRLLGIEAGFLNVRRGGHTTRLGVFPVSIDTENFLRRSAERKVQGLAAEIERPHFMFLGVDRLDYMKGLDLKLKAFRVLLQRYPQYREKVSLLQVAVPTRQGAPVFVRLARDIARLVGEINGEFSTPTWSPIHYIYSSVSFERLLALYRAADGLLVSSKRDGMNLVALEYIASQGMERPGVVLLSEFAGAISTLSHTIPINPWDLEDTARKMQLAMEMPKQEKLFRLKTMQDYLRKYTATDWAQAFISELEKQQPEESTEGPKPIAADQESVRMLRDQILEKPIRRLILFLDYDGTIVPIEQTPEKATLPPQIKKEIRQLTTRYPWLDLVVVSGRDSRFLSNQFSGIRIHMAAEHGAKYFDPELGRWNKRIHSSRIGWYSSALKIISDYAARTPFSQVEKKHYAIAWHYRQSPAEYGEFQARKLAEELEMGLANLPVSILRGKKVIEVRAIEADKGAFANFFLDDQLQERAEESTVLAFGDDKTDEDLFRAVRSRGLTFRVGMGTSVADFALRSQQELLPFVKALLASLEFAMRPKGRGPAREIVRAPDAPAL